MSFVFGSGEVAPLFEGCDSRLPHPQLEVIRKRMPQPFPEALLRAAPRPVLRHPFGEPLGEGWRYTATLAPLPADSPYATGDPTYTLHITFPPAFPEEPPHIRFACVLEHSQISDSGIVPVELLAPRWDRDSGLVWDLLETCRDMLLTPLSSPEMEEDRRRESAMLTDKWILEFWAHHEPSCACIPGRLLPCSFEEFSAKAEEEQAALVHTFRKKMRQRHLLVFDYQAQFMRKRLETCRAWGERTTFPELMSAGATGWREEWFDPALLAALKDGSPDALQAILRTEAPGIFSFPMFTPAFCERLMQELRAFEASDLPKQRPNSMNNYGHILNNMGLEGALDELLARYIQPFVKLLFLGITGGYPVDHHHTFVVEYKEGHDLLLDMHTDDSEVTVNVNLCDRFEGSGLSFCGLFGTTERRRLAHVYEHKLGRAVIHAGLHTHGADALERGERHNLIIWCRSSEFRQTELYLQRYQKPTLEEQEPDLRCLSKTHDRDYELWMGGTAGQEDAEK